MGKIFLLLIVFGMTSGCEVVWRVPPANGWVVDAQTRQPIAHARITRTYDEKQKKTWTDSHGFFRFRGKRDWQLAIGDTMTAQTTYRIEMIGYESMTIETNRYGFGTAHVKKLRDALGEIELMRTR